MFLACCAVTGIADASPEYISFFESPHGLAFLHRLITAAHFEFTKVGVASIHNVLTFLKHVELSPLWPVRTLLNREFRKRWTMRSTFSVNLNAID